MSACVLDIAWDETARDGLPDLVGPFESDAEAQEWARLNVPNRTVRLRPLTYPYLRATVTR